MKTHKILFLFSTIFVIANESVGAGHGKRGPTKRRKSGEENSASGERAAAAERDQPNSTWAGVTVAGGQTEQSAEGLQMGQHSQRWATDQGQTTAERVQWPDQLFQQQTEEVILSQPHYTFPILSSDQTDGQTFGETPHSPGAFGKGQAEQSAASEHQIPQISAVHSDAVENQYIEAILPPLPTSTLSQQMESPFSTYAHLEKYAPKAENKPGLRFRHTMGPPPPPQQMLFTELPQTNASAVRTPSGHFTRLLAQTQKPPLAHLNIPRVQNPFLYGAQSSNWRGMPLGSPSSSNLHGVPLESPPSLQGLFLHSPTSAVVPRQTAPNSPSLPLQKLTDSLPLFPSPSAEPQNAAGHSLAMEGNSFFMLPNRTLTIREGNAPQSQEHHQHHQQQQQQQPMGEVDRKMKRPMYKKAGEGPNPTEVQNAQMAWPEIAGRAESKPFIMMEQKVGHIVSLTLLSMNFHLQHFDGPIFNAMNGFGINFDYLLTEFQYRITQTDAESVLENVKNRIIQSQSCHRIDELDWALEDIQRQAVRMFGQPLFSNGNNSHESKVKVEEEQKHSEKCAMAYFFFSRLYRKLAGLLEAPFFGSTSTNKNSVKSLREVLLIWFAKAREHLDEQFEKIIKKTYADSEAKQNLMVTFARMDETRERLNVAQITIELTVAPLVGPQMFHLTLEQSLKQMHKILVDNLATSIIDKGPFDLKLIEGFARNYNSRLGAAFTFRQMFGVTISERRNISENPIYKILEIYSVLYQKALNFLSPEFELLASMNGLFFQCWKSVKDFLAVSLQQFANARAGGHFEGDGGKNNR